MHTINNKLCKTWSSRTPVTYLKTVAIAHYPRYFSRVQGKLPVILLFWVASFSSSWKFRMICGERWTAKTAVCSQRETNTAKKQQIRDRIQQKFSTKPPEILFAKEDYIHTNLFHFTEQNCLGQVDLVGHQPTLNTTSIANFTEILSHTFLRAAPLYLESYLPSKCADIM